MARVRRQAAEWAALIDQWRQSGLSLPAFCQRHGLSRGTMQNWVYKPELKRAVRGRPGAKPKRRSTSLPHPPPVPAFLPVRVVRGRRRASRRRTARASRSCSGRAGGSSIGPGFDAETLRRVVAVLEGRPC